MRSHPLLKGLYMLAAENTKLSVPRAPGLLGSICRRGKTRIYVATPRSALYERTLQALPRAHFQNNVVGRVSSLRTHEAWLGDSRARSAQRPKTAKHKLGTSSRYSIPYACLLEVEYTSTNAIYTYMYIYYAHRQETTREVPDRKLLLREALQASRPLGTKTARGRCPMASSTRVLSGLQLPCLLEAQMPFQV